MLEVRAWELLSVFFSQWFAIILLLVLLGKARRERDRLIRQPFIKPYKEAKPHEKENSRNPIRAGLPINQLIKSPQTEKSYKYCQNYLAHLKRIISKLKEGSNHD